MRSSDNTKWQACMRETDADRSWQAGHGEPWTSKRDEQGRDRRKAFLSWFLPFTVNLEDLQMHVLAHSSERANSESTGDASKKWRHKNGSKVFMLTSAKKKNKRENSASWKVWWLDNSKAHKVLNEGREPRNNHRHAIKIQILATRWNPCWTKTSQETENNFQKIAETVAWRQNLFIQTIYQNVASIV